MLGPMLGPTPNVFFPDTEARIPASRSCRFVPGRFLCSCVSCRHAKIPGSSDLLFQDGISAVYIARPRHAEDHGFRIKSHKFSVITFSISKTCPCICLLSVRNAVSVLISVLSEQSARFLAATRTTLRWRFWSLTKMPKTGASRHHDELKFTLAQSDTRLCISMCTLMQFHSHRIHSRQQKNPTVAVRTF